MDKKTLLLAQVLMTFLMAFGMSGILSALHMGVNAEWLHFWPRQFIIAWPIAFVMTQLCSRVAFPLAFFVMGWLRGDTGAPQGK